MVYVAGFETDRYELDTFDTDTLIQQRRDDETERLRLEANEATIIDELDCRRAYAAIAGHIRRAVLDSASVVIDTGRRQRLFTPPAAGP